MWKNQTRIAALAVLLASALALAAEAPLAVHPLVIVGGSAEEAEQLELVLANEALALKVLLVDPRRLNESLVKTEKSSCAGDDGCLANLARSVGASRTLIVTVAPFAPMLVLTGRLVSAHGSLLGSVSDVRVPRDGRNTPELFAVGLRSVFSQLPLSASVPAAAVKTSPEPKRALFQVERPAAAAAAVGGGALVVTGLAFLVQSQRHATAYDTLYNNGEVASSEVPRLAALRDAADGARTTGAVVGLVGVAALGLSTFLFLREPDAEVALLAGPTSIGLRVQFSP